MIQKVSPRKRACLPVGRDFAFGLTKTNSQAIFKAFGGLLKRLETGYWVLIFMLLAALGGFLLVAANLFFRSQY